MNMRGRMDEEKKKREQLDNEAKLHEMVSIAELLSTMVLLPVDGTEGSAKLMKGRIETALLLRGINLDSPLAADLVEMTMQHLSKERDRVVRAFVELGDARQRMNDPRTTCNGCPTCDSVRSSDAIAARERSTGRDFVRRQDPYDFLLTKELRKTQTDDDKKSSIEFLKNVSSGLKRLGYHAVGGGRGIAELFLDLLRGRNPGSVQVIPLGSIGQGEEDDDSGFPADHG